LASRTGEDAGAWQWFAAFLTGGSEALDQLFATKKLR
jgi:hypothetical protein